VQQLESIIKQTVKPSIINIYDDCSSDGTVSLINEFIEENIFNLDVKINVTINEKRLGYASNFCRNLKDVTCEMVFFCDQDDVWIKNKAEIILSSSAQNKEIDLFFTNAYLVDSELNSLGYTLWDLLKINSFTKLTYDEILFKKLLVTGATMAIRKRMIDNFRFPGGDVPHDYYISVICSFFGGILAIEEPCILYRQHTNNVLGAKRRSALLNVKMIFNNEKFVERYKFINIKKSVMIHLIENGYIDNSSYSERLNFFQMVSQISQRNLLDNVCFFVSNFRNYSRYDLGFKGIILDAFYSLLVKVRRKCDV
jgi:glycosyltransferase involved in cell wall biosynthesis